MKHHKVRRTILLALAVVFLAANAIWDALIVGARWIAALIPWTRFKRALVTIVGRLPAPLVLLIFLVPFLIVEPMLVVATVAIAMGYVFLGVIAWIVLKLLSIALIPAIFDLTQHRLMTMPWFVWAYKKVMAWRHYADRIVAPYKHAAAALMRKWRMQGAAAMGRMPGMAGLAARFAARKRAGKGGRLARLGG